PFDRRPLVALGLQHLRKGNYGSAVRYLSQAVEWYEARPGYAEAATRLSLAEAYEKSGNLGLAIEQWKKVASMPEIWEEDEGTCGRAQEKLKEHKSIDEMHETENE